MLSSMWVAVVDPPLAQSLGADQTVSRATLPLWATLLIGLAPVLVAGFSVWAVWASGDRSRRQHEAQTKETENNARVTEYRQWLRGEGQRLYSAVYASARELSEVFGSFKSRFDRLLLLKNKPILAEREELRAWYQQVCAAQSALQRDISSLELLAPEPIRKTSGELGALSGRVRRRAYARWKEPLEWEEACLAARAEFDGKLAEFSQSARAALETDLVLLAPKGIAATDASSSDRR
jgi:hypothetical protein